MKQLIPFLLLCAACAPLAPPSAVPPGPALPVDDSCGATPYGYLIGEPATALERVLILRPVRVLRPGDAMTMDFNPERMNFLIDEGDRIARITCG